MIKTTTLENVINEVHQESINHFDEVMPVHEMSFDSLNQMWISLQTQWHDSWCAYSFLHKHWQIVNYSSI